MRKILLVIALCLLTGCRHQDTVSSSSLNTYHADLKKIKNEKNFYDYHKNFRTQLIYNKLGHYYSYDLIISHAKISMYHIAAVSYSPAIKDEYHPSLGIFDQQAYHMVPGKVNKKKGYVKGFDLSGRVKKKTNIKMLISYSPDQQQSKRITRIVQVKL